MHAHQPYLPYTRQGSSAWYWVVDVVMLAGHGVGSVAELSNGSKRDQTFPAELVSALQTYCRSNQHPELIVKSFC
jgi:hypothetical protein